jgi:uncharacterized protein
MRATQADFGPRIRRTCVIQTVRLDQVSPQRWRNGGGSTQELLTWPTATDWIVRISVAQIERDGPFSAYPGIERWFAVVSGGGVTLGFDGQAIHLTAESDPLQFDGATSPGCVLRGGPTTDLNLMVHSASARGGMQRVAPAADWHSDARFRAVYSAEEATLEVDATASVSIAAGTLAWSDSSAGERWRLIADNAALSAWWMEVWPKR